MVKPSILMLVLDILFCLGMDVLIHGYNVWLSTFTSISSYQVILLSVFYSQQNQAG
jgi:hypothetical protein